MLTADMGALVSKMFAQEVSKVEPDRNAYRNGFFIDEH
jgi:hypothetical protein